MKIGNALKNATFGVALTLGMACSSGKTVLPNGAQTNTTTTPPTVTTVNPNPNGTVTIPNQPYNWNPFSGSGQGQTIVAAEIEIKGGLIVAWGQQRCASLGDYLSIAQGEGRFQWAEKYIIGAKNSEYAAYDALYKIARQAKDANGNSLRLYPTYAFPKSDGGYSLPNGQMPTSPISSVVSLPSGYKLVAFCVPSCYTKDQLVHFADPSQQFVNNLESDTFAVEIAKAKSNFEQNPGSFNVVTISPDSNGKNISLGTSKVDSFVSDMVVPNPKPQTFYEFLTNRGNKLVVTEGHGLVDGKGKLRTAEDLAQGHKDGASESLLTYQGNSELLASIQKLELPELSYNLRVHTQSHDIKEHLVLAGSAGFIAGDAYLQGLLEKSKDDLNRKLDRENVPMELFQ